MCCGFRFAWLWRIRLRSEWYKGQYRGTSSVLPSPIIPTLILFFPRYRAYELATRPILRVAPRLRILWEAKHHRRTDMAPVVWYAWPGMFDPFNIMCHLSYCDFSSGLTFLCRGHSNPIYVDIEGNWLGWNSSSTYAKWPFGGTPRVLQAFIRRSVETPSYVSCTVTSRCTSYTASLRMWLLIICGTFRLLFGPLHIAVTSILVYRKGRR
jgi:hypothetical protein